MFCGGCLCIQIDVADIYSFHRGVTATTFYLTTGPNFLLKCQVKWAGLFENTLHHVALH